LILGSSGVRPAPTSAPAQILKDGVELNHSSNTGEFQKLPQFPIPQGED